MTVADPQNTLQGAPGPPTALLLINAGRLARQVVEGRLRAVGISLKHVSALGHLSRQPGLSYSELARRAGITVQSMQNTLRELEDRGAVAGSTGPGRGRAAQLYVTADGQALLRSATGVFSAAEQEMFDRLSAEQRVALAATLIAVLQPAGTPDRRADPGIPGVPDSSRR